MLTKIWEIYDLEKIEKVKQREIPRFRHRGIRSLMRGGDSECLSTILIYNNQKMCSFCD